MIKVLLTAFLVSVFGMSFSQGISATPKDTTSTPYSGEQFVPVEKMPEFPGGITKFYAYIQRRFKCSRANRTDEKIFVEFVVDSTGYIRKGAVKFLHGEMGQVCKDRITSVLENSPKWTPGHATDTKKDVPVRMVLPMNLK
jgi:hypothetical protein